MITITELPDRLKTPENIRLEDEPLLKYVTQTVKMNCPTVDFRSLADINHSQGATLIFLHRYYDGKISLAFKDAYLNNKELQDTLVAFGIDVSAFWYLMLFLKDYVDDESEGPKITNNAFAKIEELMQAMYKMSFSENPFDGSYTGCTKAGTLEFKVERGKNNKRIIINDDKTLFAIFNALCSFYQKNKPRLMTEVIDGKREEINCYDINPDNEYLFDTIKSKQRQTLKIPDTYRISYFARYMLEFLRPFTSTNKDTRISKDKYLLISRVIYIIGYSNDERYNTRKREDKIHDLDFLKNNLPKGKYQDKVQRQIY